LNNYSIYFPLINQLKERRLDGKRVFLIAVFICSSFVSLLLMLILLKGVLL